MCVNVILTEENSQNTTGFNNVIPPESDILE